MSNQHKALRLYRGYGKHLEILIAVIVIHFYYYFSRVKESYMDHKGFLIKSYAIKF